MVETSHPSFPGYETIIIERDFEKGTLTLQGEAPTDVSFSPEVVEMIRLGDCGWCSMRFDVDPTGSHDVIEMWLTGLTLRYRLTGERDFTGGLVAERVTTDGEGVRWQD